MQVQNTPPDRSRLGATPSWKKVLLYLGLVILIVGLNYWTARNETRQKPEAAAKASATADRNSSISAGPSNQPGADTNESPQGARSSGTTSNRSSNKDERPIIAKSTSRNETPPATNDGDDGPVIRNMRIRDQDGRVVYSGDVDLRPTLDRIARGKRLRFPNDGVVFENRERRLPAKPSGYYHEYVLPTRGDDGPGPQRIITGSESEVYYTPDHYKSFRRIK